VVIAYAFILCCSEDVGEVYPISRIKEEGKTQKDLYGQGSQQETYYAVSHFPASPVSAAIVVWWVC